jgi:beta-barrel assembly-enhancing protease
MRRALIACLLAGSAPAAAVVPAEETPFQRVQRIDARVATIGHRLAVANLAWCSEKQWQWGFIVTDIAALDPSYRGTAIAAFGAEAGIGVTALAAGGPAEAAGLQAGDILLRLDGRPLARTEAGARPSESAIAEMLRSIEEAFADRRATLEVSRRGHAVSVTVEAVESCSSLFQAVPGDSRRARANGRSVHVTAALVDYAADDAELAAILAHELAHNILRHRLRVEGVARGFLGIGRNTGRIRETEIEADRLSVYLMERAGYEAEGAIRFWRRFGPHPLNFLRVRDHPDWRDRITLMQTEIAAIVRARQAGREPRPQFVTLPLAPR